MAFLLFYCSLYGFIYSINLIYNFSDFSHIFHYITFTISFIITGIFFSFLHKKHETIFLIFRSNCIIFSIIYLFFLIVFFINNIIPSLFIIINSIFPIITLLSVIIYDFYLKEEKKYIFSFFLLYIFIVSNYFIVSLFPALSLWYIFLGMVSFYMIVYTFVFSRIIYFYEFKYISEIVGIIS